MIAERVTGPPPPNLVVLGHNEDAIVFGGLYISERGGGKRGVELTGEIFDDIRCRNRPCDAGMKKLPGHKQRPGEDAGFDFIGA